MDATMTDPLVGRRLDGRYVIERRVARGGMASVYTATDTRLDRMVAVKVMHPALADDEEFVARFIREAKAAAGLAHPNVVAVFDQGTDGEQVYLVMEYVAGRTLREVLRERRRLSPGQALSVVEPVLEALAAAHRAGIVHRDVKPENVLIADDGRVKVADFGLARAISGSHLTSTQGLLIGTVAYLAPEQVSRGVADARADVYAVGVMLYELLTGEQPFTGETPLAVAYRHVHERVPPPSLRAPTVPKALDRLVGRATAPDPAERPADAGRLLEEARSVRDGIGPDAPLPLPPSEDALTQVVPRRADTVVVGPGGAAAPPAPRPGRSLLARRWPWVAALLAVVTALAGVAGWWLAAGRYTSAPRLVGLQLAAARATAQHDGFTVKLGPKVYSDTVRAGLVARQNPKPDDRVLHGATITLFASLGPEMHDVPNVVGAGLDAAKAEIKKARLNPVVDPAEYSDTVPAGKVIRTDPIAGTSVRHDSDVHLVPSKGPTPVAVPDVTGMSQADATAALVAAGLKAGTVAQAYSDTVPQGQVMAQNPPGGGTLPKGSAVALTVSRGPHLYPVPNVTGMQVDQAQRVLKDAGFESRVLSFPGGPGQVLRQSPGAGEMKRKGSTITLYVF